MKDISAKRILLLIAVLVAARAGAATIITDQFNSGLDGWVDSNPAQMPVTADTGFGLSLGSIKGVFAAQSLAFVQTGAFVATNTTDSGAFTGNYWTGATNFTGFTFNFYADTILPSDFILTFNGNGSTFSYSLENQSMGVGAWSSLAVPLTYGSGWLGGNATAFSNSLTSVQYVDVQLTRNGTSQQTYWLDNFALTNQPLDINLVPEPGTGVLALGGLAAILARRRIRRQLGLIATPRRTR